MKKLIALVVLLFNVMISSTAAATDRVLIGSNEFYTIYADNNSIRRDYNYSGYVFRAFVKWVYSDAGRNRLIEQYRSKGQPLPRGIYNLSDWVQLIYFKAGDGVKYISVVNAVYHTHDGSPIPEMGGSRSELQWTIINPGSIGEAEFDAIYARVPN